MKMLEKIYPRCRSLLDPGTWDRLARSGPPESGPEAFPQILADRVGTSVPDFLPELAQLELDLFEAKSEKTKIPSHVARLTLNPTLRLRQFSWKHLGPVLKGGKDALPLRSGSETEFVMVWQDPRRDETQVVVPSEQDLLMLKMVAESLGPEDLAEAGGFPLAEINSAVDLAVARGILLAPESLIRRDPKTFPMGLDTPEHFFRAPIFTLQWHVTQACDLHCKHCYDRSDRSPLSLDQGIEVLDDLASFCRSRNVRGRVTFTGGNPLLYPHIFELYKGASERGFYISILGNPSPREKIQRLIDIQPPDNFQVSLEGLRDHNDTIRGPGHFDRTLEFLEILRHLGIPSTVMLTLTRDNMEQVLPLAEALRGLTERFTFNRLSMVGEGANLELPSPEEFAAFLEQYREAAETNPVMRLKDNLFNIQNYKEQAPSFGGCTGYGCGAAFNFLTLLPDGETHACRKFPSLVGNLFRQGLSEIYDSKIARRYRQGAQPCRSCPIRPVCGGCLAVAYSCGLDVFENRDPFCFMDGPTPDKGLHGFSVSYCKEGHSS